MDKKTVDKSDSMYTEALKAFGIKLSELKGNFDKFKFESIDKYYEGVADKTTIGESELTLVKFNFLDGKFNTAKDNHYWISSRKYQLSEFGTTSVTLPTVKVTITLEKTMLDLKVGEEKTLANVVEGTDEALTWTSSNPDVATVDSNGKITAVAKGTATITASIGEDKAECEVTVEDVYTVTEEQWDAIFGGATNYTYSKKDRNDNITEEVKVSVDETAKVVVVSYKTGESEVIFVTTLTEVVKYKKVGEQWTKTVLNDTNDEDYIAVDNFTKVDLSGFDGNYGKVQGARNAYDVYTYTLINSETNPIEIDVIDDDGQTSKVTISGLEFAFVNGNLDNGYFSYANVVDDVKTYVKIYVDAVGTTTIDVPQVADPEEPETPTGSEVTAEQWASILGVPAENVSVVAGMMVASGGTSTFMPVMTFATDATWTKTTVVSATGVSYKFFTTESDGKSYSYTSADGVTVDLSSKTLVEDLAADSDYMTAYGTCIGNVMFAGSFAGFTFDSASGAYTAASLTITVSDESALAESEIVGDEEDPTAPETMTFTNVKIVFVNGALYSLEYTQNQGTGDVIFKYSAYGTTVAAPTNEPAASTEVTVL